MTIFAEWSGRYVVAAPAGRSALLAEGVALATQRRVLLKQRIHEDPQRPLAAAVPMTARHQLPAEIVSILEERVSGQGELARVAATPVPGARLPSRSITRR